MQKAFVIIIAALLMGLSSCVDGTNVLPNVTGKAGEVLLIIDEPIWGNEIGDSVYNFFSQDVAGIPWEEPFYDVSRVDHNGFLKILLTARNIVDVDVSRRYTQTKVKYYRDLYSETQTYVKIQAPTGEAVLEILGTEGEKILRFFNNAERKRTLSQYLKYNNKELVKQVFDSTGVQMVIPSNYNRIKWGKNCVWMMAGRSKSIQKNMVIYWYDYKHQDDFNVKNLVAKRDSILKSNISGPTEGSYMKTGEFYPPVLTKFKYDSMFIADLRGIWEMEGDMMGGPFFSHSKVDEKRNRVVTIEGFVYAPSKNKRNHLRQIEAMVFTAKFPESLN